MDCSFVDVLDSLVFVSVLFLVVIHCLDLSDVSVSTQCTPPPPTARSSAVRPSRRGERTATAARRRSSLWYHRSEDLFIDTLYVGKTDAETVKEFEICFV